MGLKLNGTEFSLRTAPSLCKIRHGQYQGDQEPCTKLLLEEAEKSTTKPVDDRQTDLESPFLISSGHFLTCHVQWAAVHGCRLLPLTKGEASLTKPYNVPVRESTYISRGEIRIQVTTPLLSGFSPLRLLLLDHAPTSTRSENR